MKKSTLVFPSIHALGHFKATLQTNNVEIIISKNTLICECREADIELAVNKYGAKVYKDDESQYA